MNCNCGGILAFQRTLCIVTSSLSSPSSSCCRCLLQPNVLRLSHLIRYSFHPKPYPQNSPTGAFWYGTESLWTSLPFDGAWGGGLHNDKAYATGSFSFGLKAMTWKRIGAETYHHWSASRWGFAICSSSAWKQCLSVEQLQIATGDGNSLRNSDGRLLGTHGSLRRSHLNLHHIGEALSRSCCVCAFPEPCHRVTCIHRRPFDLLLCISVRRMIHTRSGASHRRPKRNRAGAGNNQS